MTIHIPRLDTSGSITDPLTQIDIILAYCFATDKKQSIIYKNIVSFIDITSDVTQTPIEYCKIIKNGLKITFNNYFGNDKVNIDVTYKEQTEKATYKVIVVITILESLQKISKDIIIKDGKFEGIVKTQ